MNAILILGFVWIQFNTTLDVKAPIAIFSLLEVALIDAIFKDGKVSGKA